MPGMLDAIFGGEGYGRDPNTGRVLNDRFHQMRGAVTSEDQPVREFARMSPEQQMRVAEQLITSRGAPVTPQNIELAKEYMMGGAMSRFGAEMQPTEEMISSGIDAADSGGGGSISTPMQSPAPAPRPTAVPGADNEGGTPDWITAALAGAGVGLGATAAARGRGQPSDVAPTMDTAVPQQAAPQLMLPPPDANTANPSFATSRNLATVPLGDSGATLTRNEDGSYTSRSPTMGDWHVDVADPLYEKVDRMFKNNIAGNEYMPPLPQPRVNVDAMARAVR